MFQRLGSPAAVLLAVTCTLAAPMANAAAAKAAAQEPVPHRVLPTISDDYPKALAKARAAQLPIFIESWAPW